MSDSAVNTIKNVGIGAGVAVATITALPIAGAVGTITAAGVVASSTVGGIAGFFDSIFD